MICAMAFCHVADSAPRKNRKAQQEQPAAKPLSAYESLFNDKECRTEKGLLTLHKVSGRLLVEMPLDLMERDILIGSTISAITDNRFVGVGEKPRAPMQVFFSLDGKRVNMCRRRFDLLAKGDDLAEGLRRNTLPGIVSSYEVKAYNQDSTAVVIDMTDLFLDNTAELNPFPPTNPSDPMQISQKFRKDLSALEDIKAFEDNVSIRSRLSYSVTLRNMRTKSVLMTDAPFTVEVTRSIILLPEEPARVRYADPRIGTFFQHKSVFAGANEGVKTVFYAKRWRLEPSDSIAYAAGELVEPRTPISFYIDDAFPQSWKPFVKKGVEVWNKAFEKIGFRNAVRALPFPADDPTFDPDNIRYNCVRYTPSETTNSAGPSWSDPRTGEIINASVYVYHNIVKLLQDWLFVQTSQVDPSVRGTKLPEQLVGECVAYVVSHEVGHCLGLMHNMAGSSSIPVDSLRSPSFTSRYGTTHSIMDYARFNYIAQPGDLEKGVKLTPPELGKYDYYAIEWLYRPVQGAATAEDEVPYLCKFITERSSDPAYRYGKQQVKARVDPSSFEEDLGDDPVKAAEYGISNLKYIAANFNAWLAEEDPDFTFRQRMFDQIVTQYQRYVTRVLYNIGGIYLNERYDGDALSSYSLVPADEQKASVKFLLNETKQLSWFDDCSIAKGWPLKSPIAQTMGTALFRTVLQRCGNLWYSSPLMEADPYGQTEFLNDVAAFVWGPTKAGKSLTQMEMELQNQFVSYLMTNSDVVRNFVQNKPGYVSFASEEETWIPQEYLGFAQFAGMQGAVPAVKHICFAKVKEALALLKSKAHSGNAETRQHYALLVFRIEKELK